MVTASEWFSSVARNTERAVGSPVAFVIACLLLVVWALCGPVFNYSDTWQLIVNTATTILTMLIVILIQNTQTRDTKAVQAKLDELIRVNEQARNSLIKAEELDQEQLDELREKG
jgi:low affinity Fe/Cu permease